MSGRAAAAGLVGAAVAAGAIVAGPLPLLAVALVGGGLATGQVLRAARAGGIRPSGVSALAGTAAVLVVAHLRGVDGPRVYPGIVAAVVGAAFLEMLARRDRARLTDGLAYTILPVLLVGVLGSYVLALRDLRGGTTLALALVAMVVAAGVTPALVAMRVDPLPAWARAAAAAAGTLLVAVVASSVAPDVLAWDASVVLAVLVAAVEPAGRAAAGLLAPDGVLRQVDGLLLAAPVYFYAFRLFEG